MSDTIIEKPSRGKDSGKIYYTLSWGRGKGQRAATAIFTYIKPKDQIQKNHNKEVHAILEIKKSQMILDRQSIAAGLPSAHWGLRFQNKKSLQVDVY